MKGRLSLIAVLLVALLAVVPAQVGARAVNEMPEAIAAIAEPRAAPVCAPQAAILSSASPAGVVPDHYAPVAIPIPGLDSFAAGLDNAMYQFYWGVAQMFWLPHVAMLTISVFIDDVAGGISTGILPIVLDMTISYVRGTEVLAAAATLAVILAALGLVASYLDFKLVDLRKFLMYGLLASLFLAAGGSGIAQVDGLRTTMAEELYTRAFSSISARDFGSGIPAAGSDIGGIELHNYYSSNRDEIDVAMSAVMVNEGEEGSTNLPNAYQTVYFAQPAIFESPPEARVTALDLARIGLTRLVVALPLSGAAVLYSVVKLLFALASFFLLSMLPFSIVFSFFLPTENITFSILRQYMMLIIGYLTVALITGLGASVLLSAAQRGSVPLAIAGGAFSGVLNLFALNVAFGMVQSSLTAFTGSLSQTLGVKPLEAVAGEMVGTGVGLAGAGLAIAAGLPMLAPVAGGDPSAERARGLLRTGLGLAGGMMMQRTALQGPMMAAGMLGGMDMGEMVRESSAFDVVYAGMSARAANPVGMMIALDRARMRRERIDRRAARHQALTGEPAMAARTGEPATAAQQPTTQSDGEPGSLLRRVPRDRREASQGKAVLNSPWEAEIQAAARAHGQKFVQAFAESISRVTDALRELGLGEREIREMFLDDQGRPSMATSGGRRVYDALPRGAQLAMRDEAAQLAANGLIGQAVMPQMSIGREDLGRAIAEAVEAGATEGAQAVAKSLGVSPLVLGGSYGTINAVVARAQLMGVSGDEFRSGGSETLGLFPESITTYQTRVVSGVSIPET